MANLIKKLFLFANHPSVAIQYVKTKSSLIPYAIGSGYSLPPKVIFIAINSVCNLRCKMCDVGQIKKDTQFYKNMVASRQELSLGRLKKLVDEVKDFHPIIAITSTEPLLYKDIITFIEYAINNHVEIHITTNGYLLPNYAKSLIQAGVSLIQISIDGPPAIHNKIRGRENSFERTYEGIKIINDIKLAKHIDYPKIHVNYTISNYNYFALNDFVESIKEQNIDKISFSHLNFITEGVAEKHNKLYGHICRATQSSISAVDLSEIDIDVLWNQIKIIKKKYRNCHFVPDLTKDELYLFYQHPELFLPGHDKCKLPWHTAQILANGDLTLSTRCYNLKLGNINEQSFNDAWNSEAMQTFRKELRKVGAFPACSRCCGLL